MIISLDEAKLHLAITNTRQDTLITGMLKAAEEACVRYIGGFDEEDPAPEVLRQAILETLATMYEGREGSGIPDAAQMLLRDLREWVFG